MFKSGELRVEREEVALGRNKQRAAPGCGAALLCHEVFLLVLYSEQNVINYSDIY